MSENKISITSARQSKYIYIYIYICITDNQNKGQKIAQSISSIDLTTLERILVMQGENEKKLPTIRGRNYRVNFKVDNCRKKYEGLK
jgi:hypothetical protein